MRKNPPYKIPAMFCDLAIICLFYWVFSVSMFLALATTNIFTNMLPEELLTFFAYSTAISFSVMVISGIICFVTDRVKEKMEN